MARLRIFTTSLRRKLHGWRDWSRKQQRLNEVEHLTWLNGPPRSYRFMTVFASVFFFGWMLILAGKIVLWLLG